MPLQCTNLTTLDCTPTPLTGSTVATHNRVDYRTHEGLLKFTSGSGLSGFYNRWASSFLARINALDVHDSWVEMPDLMDFFDQNFGSSLTEAICGPSLAQINPTWRKDFIQYEKVIPSLLKGLPRWLDTKTYDVRDKLLVSIQRWHDYARAHFSLPTVSPGDDTDPY